MPILKTIIRFLVIIFIAVIVIVIMNYAAKDEGQAPAESNQEANQENLQVAELKKNNETIVDQARVSEQVRVEAAGPDDHIWGELGAPVELIIYDNFDCRYCAEFYDTVQRIKQDYGDKIAVVYRHYPLRIHPMAYEAALASECASEQGKFWEMYHKLFQANKDNKLNSGNFQEYAADVGVEADQFSQCLETEKYKDRVQEDYEEAKLYSVSGTPGSFLNGRPLPGAVPFEDYQDSEGNRQPGMKTLIKGVLDQAKSE